MSKWFVFEIKPHAASSVYEYNYTKDDLRKLHNEVSEWLDTNKRKTAKLQLISRACRTVSTSKGAMSWDDLNETYPAAFLRVKFRSERDATLFKMFYNEYFYENIDFSKIILPLFRRVMPTVIANEIIGVQPMTGPFGAALVSDAWENVKKEFVKRDG